MLSLIQNLFKVMAFLKSILQYFKRIHMNTIIDTRLNSPVADGVFNYLNMKTSGALLVTGDWGCGKTYFFKNHLFGKIQETTSFIPIMVSLFGIKELRELPERVLYAYLDKVGKNISSFGKLTQFAKNIADALPIVNNYVDINKLLGTGDGLYRIIPNNVLICFDDIERAIDIIDINEILGVINELVENRDYKVIVVANEDFIKEKECHDNNKQLVFKEKVIEKTLTYIPNIVSVFKEIVLTYDNIDFVEFLCSEDILQSINPQNKSLSKYPKLKKYLSNIRILKFAIEHFYVIYTLYHENGKSHKDDSIVKMKLKNYWIFILAITIEYKINNLSFEDNRTLATYHNIANMDIDFGYENEIDFEESEEEQDKHERAKQNEQYANMFYKKFFLRISEEPIFHQSLYDFITAGIKVDYSILDENMNQKINFKDNKINPAHELLNKFMNGYWKFKNDDIDKNLTSLLEYTENSKFEDYISYINATVYLFSLKELIGLTDEILEHKIKSGIDIFTERTEVNYIVKTNVEMAASYLSTNLKWVLDYIIQCIDNKMELDLKKEKVLLEEKFKFDLEEFTKEFLPKEQFSTPAYLNIPILKDFDLESVKTKVQHLEPNDAMCLQTFINERYIKMPIADIKEEIIFLEAIKEGLETIDLTEKKLTNIIIRDHLQPILDKALQRM